MSLVSIMMILLTREEFALLEQLLPFFDNISSHTVMDQINKIRSQIRFKGIIEDKVIGDSLISYLAHKEEPVEYPGCDCDECLEEWVEDTMGYLNYKMEIVDDFKRFEKQILHLKKNYSDFYDISLEFFDQLFDTKKRAALKQEIERELIKFVNKYKPILYTILEERGEDTDFLEHVPTFVPGVASVRSEPKVGRNEPCPCGSGKKYKRCCG